MRRNLIIGIVIGIIISTITIVSANTIIKSNEVTYDNSKSNGSFNNVQNSLDELYQKAGYTGEEYHEEILHGADPVLSGELVPVSLSENGDVYYANLHTSWYSYEYKRWANAVILVDDAYAKNREDNKDKYSVGDKISEEDIESYFVWIPRYAYKLWNIESQNNIFDASALTNKDFATSPSVLNNTRIIEIIFGTKNYLDGQKCKSLNRNSTTGEFTEPTGIAIDDYLEHPAFTLGNTELNGFWIGKFEVGYNQTNSGESSISGTINWTTGKSLVGDATSNKIVVKPNVFSWMSINISNAFLSCKNYNTDLKSHMLKNTEWGAVAYLSHSAYGKGSEININNTNDYKTGYSASPNTNQTTIPGDNYPSTSLSNDKYNSAIGYQASTTGNITGVYDMSGGSWEFVAATMISGRTTDNSGFSPETITAEIKAGYIDAYPADSNIYTFNKRILGDATGEMAPFYSYYEKGSPYWHSAWYGDFANFLHPDTPWLSRGGGCHHGILAGIFYFDRSAGEAYIARGFRLALAP